MSSEPWTYLYAIAAAQGAVLSVALWRGQTNRTANRMLAAWVLLISADLVVKALFLRSPGPSYAQWYGISLFLPFVYGSLFYLYVRVLTEARRLCRRDTIHLAGFVAVLVFNYDLLIQSPEETWALFERIAAGRTPARFAVIDVALFAYSVSYVTAAVVVVHGYRKRLRERRSDADAPALAWIDAMVACQIVIWLIAIAQWAVEIPGVDFRLIYAAVAGWVFVMGYLGLRQGDVERQPKAPGPAPNDPGDARSRDVEARLRVLMEDQKLYRQPALTIGQLASKSGYPEYLVSSVINRNLDMSFYDYINRHRIEAARAHLEDPEDRRTILDIAYDCGFTSKSTFNSAFKRLTGKTPSRYRQTRRDDSG